MDDRNDSISPPPLLTKPGLDAASTIGERHTVGAGSADKLDIPVAHGRTEEIEESRINLPSGRTVVTYCFHGPQVSQGVAAALHLMGFEQHLDDDDPN